MGGGGVLEYSDKYLSIFMIKIGRLITRRRTKVTGVGTGGGGAMGACVPPPLFRGGGAKICLCPPPTFRPGIEPTDVCDVTLAWLA